MVYLLHFSSPYKHARHYLGYTEDLQARMSRHLSGNGARLVEVVCSAGIVPVLVRVWDGDRSLERKLKCRKNSPCLCPICRSIARYGEILIEGG